MSELNIRTFELFRELPDELIHLFATSEYPWEILPEIASFVLAFIRSIPEGYHLISENVLVGENVKIASNVTFEGTAVIGSGTEVRPGAFFRGGVFIGKNCVVGNSSELKNCILIRQVQVPHYNYVGDSILGTHTHMGAGSICSNLKSDGKVTVIHCADGRKYETGLRKVGAFLGDGADVGCGSILSPGTIIGNGSRVYPLTHVRGVIPPQHIVKSSENIVTMGKGECPCAE